MKNIDKFELSVLGQELKQLKNDIKLLKIEINRLEKIRVSLLHCTECECNNCLPMPAITHIADNYK